MSIDVSVSMFCTCGASLTRNFGEQPELRVLQPLVAAFYRDHAQC